jgi:hypothetical protein
VDYGIDLYWIPLGAAGNFVRLNGRIYESIAARLEQRPARDLYHSALVVFVPEGRYTIDMTPIVDGRGAERGVVAEGPVGARWAGRFRLFRYELRRWRGGVIPDISEAVDSPHRLAATFATRNASSSWYPKSRCWCGAAMKPGQVRCGIRTR